MSQQDKPNFFDPTTIIAILVVFATYVGWQYYMQKKYPQVMQPKVEGVENSEALKTQSEIVAQPQGAISTKSTPKMENTPALPEKEQLTRYENELVQFEISSFGMGLKNFSLKEFKDRKNQQIQYGPINLLETRLNGNPNPIWFNIEKVNEHQFVGTARIGQMRITKTMELDPKSYAIKYKVGVTHPDDRFIGLSTLMPESIHEIQERSLFNHAEYEEFYVSADSHERTIFTKEDFDKTWANARTAAIGSVYFTQALVDKSQVMPEAKASLKHADKMARLQLNYTALNKAAPFEIAYTAFVGPKALHLLNQADASLGQVIDFGFFNWIARQILALLRWFHTWMGNWGLAIIGLTILVRILVLPFNIISYKSMRAMQIIQPQIQRLREKFKDDQQKLQQEMMALMREHKVNPLGGCLPILLQFPIFIALYQVLGHSVELYQAPFGLWIHDLSLKDPFYVLPVLMGATMFLQQKITPNASLDPTQAKIMLFMPVLFAFFMVSLPSGLTLYIFVSSAFAVVQQLYFVKYGHISAPKT